VFYSLLENSSLVETKINITITSSDFITKRERVS